MVRSVPGLDKCDGGGKWLPLDSSHQLLRQRRGQDKQNGTRAPRHRGRGWIVEFLIRGGAGETERRGAPMGRGAPRAPRGSNWTHRPSERIVGGGGCENQLLSDWACEYCEYSLWVLWVLWDCEGRWLGLKAVSLSLSLAAAAPQVWSGCTLQGHTSPSSTLPSCIRFARPVMAIFNGWRSQVIAFCVYVYVLGTSYTLELWNRKV